jgi:sugar phosphate isomerase/epimerase
MTLPIAAQLYSVRDEAAKDYAGTIRAIAEMGYLGVEGVRSYPDGVTAESAAQLFREYNLEVVGVHVAMPFGDDEAAMVSLLETLNCKTAICPWLDPKQYFDSLDSVKRACDLLNQANAVYRKHGFTFGYHNHWFEMQMFDQRPALHHMLELLDPTIFFEVDT